MSEILQIKLNEEFKLPFTNKDNFISLMRFGVQYSHKTHQFTFTSATKIEKALDFINRNVTKAEMFSENLCFTCKKNPVKEGMTLCDKCSVKPNAYELYVKSFNKQMKAI